MRGIEIGEKYLKGEVSIQVLSDENWAVEGAAFKIDYNTDPDSIIKWVAEIDALPSKEINNVLNKTDFKTLDTRQLLLDAAYFVDYAMSYPTFTRKKRTFKKEIKFLLPDILRSVIIDPNYSKNV